MTRTTALTPERKPTLNSVFKHDAKAPVKVWAVLGVLVAAFEIYVLFKWVSGPYSQHVPSGPTEYPVGLKIAYWGQVVFSVATLPLILWHWVIKPRVRTGRFTSEGLMIIWFLTLGWFFDPFANFFHPMENYTSYGPNWGSWIAEIPGWHSIMAGKPGATMAYPLVFLIPAYGWGVAFFVMATIGIMKWTQRRFPNLGRLGVILIAILLIGLIECAVEVLWLRSGMYVYRHAIPSLTLWYGHYYQLPLYELPLAGMFYASFGSLFYFKNDKGQTLVERGLDRLSLRPWTETTVRFFALAGILPIIFVGSYMAPVWLITEYPQEMVRDLQERSYFTNHICGPETDQTCGGKYLPQPIRGPVVHFDPHGNLVMPPDVPQPGSESAPTFRP